MKTRSTQNDRDVFEFLSNLGLPGHCNSKIHPYMILHPGIKALDTNLGVYQIIFEDCPIDILEKICVSCAHLNLTQGNYTTMFVSHMNSSSHLCRLTVQIKLQDSAQVAKALVRLSRQNEPVLLSYLIDFLKEQLCGLEDKNHEK